MGWLVRQLLLSRTGTAFVMACNKQLQQLSSDTDFLESLDIGNYHPLENSDWEMLIPLDALLNQRENQDRVIS